MTGKDLSREVVFAELVAERGKALLEWMSRAQQLEQENQNLRQVIKDMEAKRAPVEVSQEHPHSV